MRILRSPEFRRELAQCYCDQPGSGDTIVDGVLTELYDHRAGRLIGPDGTDISVGTGADAAAFDDLFGGDPRRFINRFRRNAKRLPKNRLDRRCVFPVTILHFARQIRLCRTGGRCCS